MNYNKKIDYSSISTYIACPRQFLYQYMFHFRSSRPNIHLVFGSCWHYGLEVVYNRLKDDPNSLTIIDATELSIAAFTTLWNLEGEPHFSDHDIIFPKSPGRASDMYHAYWTRYLETEDATKKIIAVESPFVINLNAIDKSEASLPNYIGRQDLLFQLPDGTLEIVDHKTAKALWKTTLSGFIMSYQTDGYLTAGEIFYDSIPKMTYSLAFFQKTAMKFERFTIVKRKAAIEQFLFELIHIVKEIQRNINLFYYELETKKLRNDNIASFPRCPGYACTMYMSNCPYFDLCGMRSNPLLWHNNPPQGYHVNEWDPDLHDEEMRKRLEEVV